MMRPTNLVNSQLSPSFGLNKRPGSPSLSPEINMMLMSNRNDDKTTDMVKIDEIHRAVTLGNLRNVQQLIDRKRLAYCRDQMGATPLHKAVIYGQKEIIEYFLDRFPSTIHTRDNRGRTPLHYAAVLPESADLYRMLAEAGADEKALDMFGKKPEDYLNHQDGVSVVVLRESAIVTRPLGQRRSRKSASRMIDPQSWSKIHSSRSLMHRSNIRELIKQGNITTLEEIVIQGYGDRLIGETSSAPLVQEFLKNVPQLIEQINELHKAAQRGNLNDMRSLLDRKGIVFARDQIGCTPLHKAVLYGQLEVTSFLSSEYPATLDARDHDGRTALHYAAGLDDDRAIYNILVKNGASPNLPDYKGRSAEYYVRFPDQINIQQLMKRSQRLNANYAINTANRIKSKSPCRRRGLSPEARKPDIHTSGYKSDTGFSDHEIGDADGGSSSGSLGDVSHSLLTKANLRSKPGSSLNFSSPAILREEVTSANLKRWIQELDLNSLEGAILEGHGDRVKSKVEMYDKAKESPDIQNYIHETLPKVMTKIRKIHAAVSCGDLTGLQDHLDKNDYALAKDHLGMAPLHKAVILGHIDVVQFILDRFPETVNARDREGRTPLHYAAATTHKNGHKIYKMLLRSGADSRARDTVGKTAEYYRVHFMPLPSELSRLAAHYKRKSGDGHQASSPLHKRRGILLPSIREKISNALHEGDASTLLELVLEGYGDALLGRASWGEEARKFLKGLPHLLDNIRTLHASIVNGELANVQRILDTDPNLIKAKDENGLMAIHLAVSRDQQEIVDYLLEKFPSCLQLKDQFGRTGLHIAAQNKQQDIYKKLIDAGGDPMIIDQRGRTADHYLKLQATGEAYLSKLFVSTPVKEDPSKRTNDKSVNSSEKNGVVNEQQDNDKEGQQSAIVEEVKENKTQNEENKTSNNEEDGNTNVTEKGPDDGILDNNQANDKNDKNGNNNLDNEVETKKEENDSGEPAQDGETVNASLQQSVRDGDNNVDLEEIKSGVGKVDVAIDAKTSSGTEDSFDSDNSPEDANDHVNNQSTPESVQTLQKELELSEKGNPEFEPDDDNKIDPSEETDNDEEKNRQDAIVNENTPSDEKETNQLGVQSTNKHSKITSKKKQTTPLQAEKKVKGNRKASLPSVVSNRNSSKDLSSKSSLDKKKTANNRNTSNFGTKGKTELDKENEVKPDSENSIDDNKVSEEVDAEESLKKLVNSNEEEEPSKVTADNTSTIAQAFIGDLPETVSVDKDEPAKETSTLPSSAEKGQGDNQTLNSADSASASPETNQSTGIEESGQLEEEHLSEDKSNNATDVERQANEIVQELVETSIQEAESKLGLNEVTKIAQESNYLKDENDTEETNGTEEEKNERENKDDRTDSDQLLEEQGNEKNPSNEIPIQKTDENNANTSLPIDETNSLGNGDLKPAESSEQKSEHEAVPASEKTSDEINADKSELESKEEPGVGETTPEVSDEKMNEEQSNDVAEEVNQKKDENVVKYGQEHDLVNESTNEEQKESNSINGISIQDVDAENGDKPELASDRDVHETNLKESGSYGQPKETNEVGENENKADTKVSDPNEQSEQNESNELEKSNSSDNINTLTNGNGVDEKESNSIIVDNTEPKDFLKTGSETSKPKSSESTSSRFINETSPVTNSDNNSDMLNDLIDTWLKEGDLLRLEHVVIAGQGERLIDKKSPKETVQEFLDLVPAYMAKIKNVHDTVVRGNFNEVRSILTRKRFALSRDHVGASPLHLAVLHGHMDVLVYIITQFPETLDGPDNEGRTPLHYAAVMASKDRQYYDILKKAGANSSLIDKLGNTADFYLDHPDELTIGDLLSNYKHKTESATKRKEPESVDVWQRPPTADIESRLTPSPSDSQLEEDKGPIHHEIAADVHVDAKIKERPISGNTVNPEEEEVKKEVETISVQFKETLKEEKNKLQESIRRIMGSVPSQPPESLSSGEESDDKKSEDTVSEYELCQVKDEHGRTVLHLVSSKPQKKAILYQMLASAEYLIPERDEKYRTIRDVAVDAGLKDNVQVIDNYILDAFVRRNVGFVQRLSHEGYDLTNVVDEEGHDVTSVLRKRKITSMINLLQDITYFQKSREELHTFIKNDYIQGVLGLIDSDSTLVTAKNRRGRTALHIAILFGNLDIISNLIDANPGAASVQDNLGRTPLHYAMATSKVEHIGKMLIKAGANRQIRDVKMRTPSYYFVYNDDIRAIRSEEKTLI